MPTFYRKMLSMKMHKPDKNGLIPNMVLILCMLPSSFDINYAVCVV